MATPDFSKSTDGPSAMKRHPVEFLQHRVCVVASELMSQVYEVHAGIFTNLKMYITILISFQFSALIMSRREY